jgi:hypothetical protein
LARSCSPLPASVRWMRTWRSSAVQRTRRT